MSTLHFDKQGSFSNAVDLTMVLNESTNNSVPIAQKVGYEFDGWVSDYTSGGSDTPIVTRTIKVYDSDGHAVRSDIFWSDDYPNGVYLSREDTTVYPIWSDAPFVKEFFDYSDQKCHLYTMVNGVLTRVEVILEDQDWS